MKTSSPLEQISNPLHRTTTLLYTLTKILESIPIFNSCACKSSELYFKMKQPLTVLVAGPFNSGKTSLINCLAGKEILPSSVIPSILAPTKICAGDSFAIFGTDTNGKVFEISFNDIMVDSCDSNPTKNKFIEFLVTIPNRFLTNVILIDSPGFDSISNWHLDLTNNASIQFDSILWVTSCGQSATASEMEIIKMLCNQIEPLVIANQTDLLGAEDERESSLERIRTRLKLSSSSFTGLSTIEALSGILSGDQKQIIASGWPLFLKTFYEFYLPSCQAKRFATLSGNLVSFVKSINILIDDEYIKYQDLESNKNMIHLKLNESIIAEESIRTTLDSFQKCLRNYSQIRKPEIGATNWLVDCIIESIIILNNILLPTVTSDFPIDLKTSWNLRLNEFTERKSHLLSNLESLERECTLIQESHWKFRKENFAVLQRRTSFNEIHPLVKIFNFQARLDLEYDEVTMRALATKDKESVLSSTQLVAELVEDVNFFSVSVSKFLQDCADVLTRSLTDAQATRVHYQRLLEDAKHKYQAQQWVCDLRQKISYEISPDLLETFMKEFANSKHLFS
jgi:hypothetical protein